MNCKFIKRKIRSQPRNQLKTCKGKVTIGIGLNFLVRNTV